jgi:hypothetical protein
MVTMKRGSLSVESLIAERDSIQKQIDSMAILKVRVKILNQLIANVGSEEPSSNGHVEGEFFCTRRGCEEIPGFLTERGLNMHIGRMHKKAR